MTTKSNAAALWHPGGNAGFIAQAICDLGAKNAILVVTNVRTSHRRLFRAVDRIKRHYSAIARFPQLD